MCAANPPQTNHWIYVNAVAAPHRPSPSTASSPPLRAAAFLSSVASSPMTTQATAATQSSIYSKTYTEWPTLLLNYSSIHFASLRLIQCFQACLPLNRASHPRRWQRRQHTLLHWRHHPSLRALLLLHCHQSSGFHESHTIFTLPNQSVKDVPSVAKSNLSWIAFIASTKRLSCTFLDDMHGWCPMSKA